jgi:hypothetical protein
VAIPDSFSFNLENPHAPDIASSQMTFRVAVKKGSLWTASPRGSLYLEWSIIRDPTDINGLENDDEIETGSSTIGGEENKESEFKTNTLQAGQYSSSSPMMRKFANTISPFHGMPMIVV